MDRTLLALALRSLGDDDGADLELTSARKALAQLGAQLDLVATEKLISESRSRRGESDEVHLTLMFTDIEGSTNLAEALGDRAWEQLIGWHDETLRALILRHQGEVVSSTGDGFFATFASAGKAVELCPHHPEGSGRASADHRVRAV